MPLINFQFSRLAIGQAIFNFQNIRKLLVNWVIGLLGYSSRSEVGQSILEVLIALTLIVLFLSGVVIVQLFAVRNMNYSENKSMAANLAKQQLDRVKVVRDTEGIDSLVVCQSSCFINSQLTPVQGITPTGTFNQVVTMQSSSACPTPTDNPAATTYQVTAKVILKGTTPTPMAEMSTCITDWR